MAERESKGKLKKCRNDLSDVSLDLVNSPGYGMSGKCGDLNATQAMIDDYVSDELDGW